MAKDSAKALKIKKKKWFSILAPRVFREVVVGEIPIYESSEMKGRCVTVNMMNLTNNPKNQHISVKLRIVDVKESKGFTQILGFSMLASSVRRYVRRGKTKIEDSFVVQTADRKLVRIKPLVVTNSVVNKSPMTSIRIAVRNNLVNLVSRYSYEKLLEEIFSFRLQRHMQGVASSITPTRNFEIRALQLVEREGVRPISATKEELVEKDEELFDDEEQQGKQADHSGEEIIEEPVEEEVKEDVD